MIEKSVGILQTLDKASDFLVDKFEEATEVVKKVILRTKLVYSDYLSNLTDNKIYLKLKNNKSRGVK